MSLVSYDASDDSSGEEMSSLDPKLSSKSLCPINSAPEVRNYTMEAKTQFSAVIDPKCKELTFNPKYDDLFAPQLGPQNPFKDERQTNRNFLTGNIEETHVSEAQFELQRKRFHAYGIANNPSDGVVTEINNKVFIALYEDIYHY